MQHSQNLSDRPGHTRHTVARSRCSGVAPGDVTLTRSVPACRPAGGLAAGDRGEGVISTAIAVLIMAFLGVAMWVGFNSIWDSAEEQTRTQVEQIGQE